MDARFADVDGSPASPDEARFGPVPWIARATTAFVAIGVLLRVARYLLNFPLWCDETMIAANFLDRGYADMFRPLIYRQVGPVLWLVVELTSVKLLGFHEYSLRLFPFLCGVASVPLFRHVAGRLMQGVPLLLAVGIFAVSGWPLRYAAEVKPYASDLFVTLGIVALALEWWRSRRTAWLWALAVAGPIAVALSLPALFVLGSVGLILLGPILKSRSTAAIAALGSFGAGVIGTFLGLMRFYRTAPQDHQYFHDAWADAFPPLNGVWSFTRWFLDVNTGFLFAYPEGGGHGASTLTFLAFVAGAWVLWRRRERFAAGLLVLPFGLALVAAALHRYPYGVSARTSQYAAPLICLLAGLGIAAVLAKLPAGSRSRLRTLQTLTVGLALLGFLRLGIDLTHPYKTATDERVRSFARWFWSELSRDAELVCFRQDMGLVFDPTHWTKDATDAYLSYQRIYSPRHRAGKPAELARVSDTHPLRCVVFNEMPQGTPAFQAWMAGISDRYQLRGIQSYPISSIERKRGPTWDQIYVVYEFVPRATPVAATAEEARR